MDYNYMNRRTLLKELVTASAAVVAVPLETTRSIMFRNNRADAWVHMTETSDKKMWLTAGVGDKILNNDSWDPTKPGWNGVSFDFYASRSHIGYWFSAEEVKGKEIVYRLKRVDS